MYHGTCSKWMPLRKFQKLCKLLPVFTIKWPFLLLNLMSLIRILSIQCVGVCVCVLSLCACFWCTVRFAVQYKFTFIQDILTVTHIGHWTFFWTQILSHSHTQKQIYTDSQCHWEFYLDVLNITPTSIHTHTYLPTHQRNFLSWIYVKISCIVIPENVVNLINV